jgi:hypothetical protein
MTKLAMISNQYGSPALRFDAAKQKLVLAAEPNDGPCCCEKGCIRVYWGRSLKSDEKPGSASGVVRITIPEKYEIPPGGFTATLLGGFDDIGTVNGISVGFGQPLPSPITLQSRVVTFTVQDTVGGNIGMGVCLCVDGVEQESFPTVPFPNKSGGSVTVNDWLVEYPPFDNYPGPGPWSNDVSTCPAN